MKRYWLIRKERPYLSSKKTSPGLRPLYMYVTYDSKEEAIQGANRLANEHNQRFVVFESVAAYEPRANIVPVEIED